MEACVRAGLRAAVEGKGGAGGPAACVEAADAPGMVAQFAEERVAVLDFIVGDAVGAPIARVGVEQAIVELRGGRAADAEVVADEAVVENAQVAVSLIEGTLVERIAYGLAPMCPAGVEPVAVVTVAGADLVRYGGGVVVIEGAALVLSVDVFVDERADPRVAGQFHFEAEQSVAPAVLEEEL